MKIISKFMTFELRCMISRRRFTKAFHAISGVVVLLAGAMTANAGELTTAPSTWQEGSTRVSTELALGLDDASGQSFTVMIDGWFVLSDRFMVGVTTSDRARARIEASRGLCIESGASGGCADRFAGVALEARAVLSPAHNDDDRPIIGRVALDASRFDPTALAAEVGLETSWHHGPWFVDAAAVLSLGLSRRDLDNGDVIAIPLSIGAQLHPRVSLALTSGFRASLDSSLFSSLQLPVFGSLRVREGAFDFVARFGTDDAWAGGSKAVVATIGIDWTS